MIIAPPANSEKMQFGHNLRPLLLIVTMAFIWIMSFILIALIASIFVGDLVQKWPILIIVTLTMVSTLLVGIPVLQKSLFVVKANTGLVMGNLAVSQLPPSQENSEHSSVQRVVRGVRQYLPGIHIKYWWENPEEAEVLKLNEVKVLKSEDCDKGYRYNLLPRVEIRNGGEKFFIPTYVTCDWQVMYSTLPWWLINRMMHTEDDIEDIIIGRVRSFLQNKLGGLSVDQLRSDKKFLEELKKEFGTVFSGPDKLDDDEKNAGIWTNLPTIFNVSPPKEQQDTATALDNILSIAKRLNGGRDIEVSNEQALRMAIFAVLASAKDGEDKASLLLIANNLFGGSGGGGRKGGGRRNSGGGGGNNLN